MSSNEADDNPSIRHLKYNVIYPNKDQQDYFPMLSLGVIDGKEVNEIDIIRSGIDRDRKDKRKHITVIYLTGPPGVGKTTLGMSLAKEFECPCQIVNCVGTMTDLDLLGSWVMIKKEMVWQDGPLSAIVRATNDDAIAHPEHTCNGVLLLEDLTALRMSAQFALHPLLDRRESVVLTICNNEVIKVADNAHLLILASYNPDILGVNDLEGAVRDRPDAFIEFDYPDPKKEAKLINFITGLDEEIALKFCNIISECRKLKEQAVISLAPSTRPLLNWIEYTSHWGIEIAFQLTVVNKYGKDAIQKKALMQIAKSQHLENIMLPKEFSPSPMRGTYYHARLDEERKKTPKKTSNRKRMLEDTNW